MLSRESGTLIPQQTIVRGISNMSVVDASFFANEAFLWHSVVAVVAGLMISSFFYRKQQVCPWMKVPGSLPLLGHLPYIGGLPYLVTKLEEWADTYGGENGCYEIDMPLVNYLVVCREDRALEIFKQRPRKIARPSAIRESTNSIGANGIFSAEGEEWKKEHKLIAAALNRSNTEEYLPILKEMAARLIEKWENADVGSSVAINNDLGGMTADSISKVMFDRDFDFLNHPESQTASSVRTVMRGALSRALSPIYYWRIPIIGQYFDGVGFAVNHVRDIVFNAVVGCQTEGTTGEKSTFLHKLISLMRTENSTIPRDRIVGNAITLFLAGTDTTEKALVQVLYLLATKPDLQRELHKEVAELDWIEASYDELYTLTPRLKSFLHETHRHIAMPMLMLSTVADIPFCGTTLRAGQDIFMLNRYCSTQLTSPSKDVPTTGLDNSTAMPPNEFNPYRYLFRDEKGALTCPDPSTKASGFLSFGYGVRACPGRQYSEVLSYCVLTAILQTFEFELAPNHPTVDQLYDARMISPSCEIQLKLTKR